MNIQALLKAGVEEKVFPGAAACIHLWDHAPQYFVQGNLTYDVDSPKVSTKTFFDLASLTKIFSTTSILAKWVDQGKILLEDKITEAIPNLPWNRAWTSVTLQDVLSHEAGFEAWQDFRGMTQEGIYHQISSSPPSYPRGQKTVYSDLGFILLGHFISNRSSMPLRDTFQEEVLAPIGAEDLFPEPLRHGIPLDRIAPCRESEGRGGQIHGEVDDDNAFALGGMAGHAGLFGTVESCWHIANAWVEAWRGGGDFLSSALARQCTVRVSGEMGASFATGWSVPSSDGSSAGDLVSKKAFGHLGFTGTSIWIDPEKSTTAILLSNRVYPTEKNLKIRAFRRRLYDEVWRAA